MIKNKRLMMIAVIFLALLPLVAAELEFTHEQAIQKLDLVGKINYYVSKGLGLTGTTVGEGRGCSQYPDSSGTVQQNTQKQVFCDGLINVYRIDQQGGWQYIGEYENTVIIETFTKPYGAAWECYQCQALPTECSGSEERCKSDSVMQYCVNGQWQDRNCGAKEFCQFSAKTCTGTQTGCIERWTCDEWSECSVTGKQTRTCRDTASCGTTSDKPAESQSCTPRIEVGSFNPYTTVAVIIVIFILIFILLRFR